MTPAMTTPTTATRNTMRATPSRKSTAIRRRHWKYIDDKPQLYDLSKDPGETENLAAAEPEKLAEMVARWRAERKRLGIVLPGDL